MKTSTSKSNVITQILFAAVAVALGYLLLFKKTVMITTICQILCGGLIVVGVVSIVSFFVSGDYKRIDRYGFALGTLLILLGAIGLVRSADVASHFELYAGLLSLILGILTLQGTVQIKVLDYAIWILNLLLSLICLIGAFCVLSEITAVTGLVDGFPNWLLLIAGVSCLFSLLTTWICILRAGRREKKAVKEAETRREEDARRAEEERKAEEARREEEARKAEEARRAEEARKEAAAQSASASAYSSYHTAADAQPSEPAESHHAGFDPGQVVQPAADDPKLEFEPSEGHHTDFTPGA